MQLITTLVKIPLQLLFGDVDADLDIRSATTSCVFPGPLYSATIELAVR